MSDDYGGYADYNNRGGGMGTFLVLCLLVGLLFLFLGLSGTGSQSGGTQSHTAEALSRNKFMSDNQMRVDIQPQLNLFSDVKNCNGDYSCMNVTYVTQTVTTVAGDRSPVNVQVAPPGQCLDPVTNAYTSSACNGTYGSVSGGRP